MRQRRRAVSIAAALLVLTIMTTRAEAQDRPIPPPDGPYVGLDARAFDGVPSYGPAEKVVMTYYFYWYDAPTKGHILDGDGSDALTTHPASLEDYSYRSVAWHRRQLEDMIAAGIDVVLPVYWGAPSERAPGASLHWSFAGLPPLVQALDELVKEGKRPPRVGLFYDTSTLQYNAWGYHADLTTDYGRQWFYASIRDFFAQIPPRHWALVDGKPVIGLYSASFAKAHDQSTIDFVKARFPEDFGGKVPYIIREVSWNVRADNVYGWGGAVNPNFLGVAEVGPGYDHSAVPGRTPLVVDRQGGKFYESAWLKALRRKPRIAIVETWNEHHEGTDVADSREYGRQYIDLTRRYADLFRQGWTPPPVQGPYTGASAVEIELGAQDAAKGLRRIEVADGVTEPARFGESTCRVARAGPGNPRYIYFAVDDSFKDPGPMDVVVEVEYFDSPGAGGRFQLHYDSADDTAPFSGAYTEAPVSVPLQGTGHWQTGRIPAPAARFAGLENGGADFRLAVGTPELAIRRVAVRKGTAADGTTAGRQQP